jgi:hypothetical protein
VKCNDGLRLRLLRRVARGVIIGGVVRSRPSRGGDGLDDTADVLLVL